MGELGEYWREHREYKRKVQNKRNAAVPRAIALLDEAKISYEVLSHTHYRVNGTHDWWPTTGYWKRLDGSKNGLKVRSLIRDIETLRK